MATNTSDKKKKTKMRSKSYGSEVVKSLSMLKQSDELCDFEVKAEGKSLQVHKVLLAATSDYFRAMLCGPMKESKEDKVDLKGLTADALEQIVDFIYSGEMEIDMDNLIEILNASSHLQVQTALNLCSDYMISLLTFKNSEELLPIADTYSLTSVTDYYNKKVLCNFEEFSDTEQFKVLQSSQLVKYLADDSLHIRSEEQLFDIIGKWVMHEQSRMESLENTIKCIRFCLLSESQLQQLRQHWLTLRYLTTSINNYLADGLKYHSDAHVGHPWLTDGAKVRTQDKSFIMVHQGTSYRPFEITAYDCEDSKFYQLVTDISGSRDCRVASVDNFVYMCRVVDCGGGTLMGSLLRFDPRHLALQELTPCRRLRIDPALVAKEKWLYIMGGTNENYVVLDSVECYDVRSNTWMDLLPLPTPTHSHAAAVCDGDIYVSGGLTAQGGLPTTSLLSYRPGAHTWENRPAMHNPRRLHEMVAIQGKLYVVGGIGAHSFHQQTQIPIECFDSDTGQWTIMSSTLAGRSIGHFMHYQGKILAIGRELYEATEEDIWTYDTETDTWQMFTKAPKRVRLPSGLLSTLSLNFFDAKVAKCVINSDKR